MFDAAGHRIFIVAPGTVVRNDHAGQTAFRPLRGSVELGAIGIDFFQYSFLVEASGQEEVAIVLRGAALDGIFMAGGAGGSVEVRAKAFAPGKGLFEDGSPEFEGRKLPRIEPRDGCSEVAGDIRFFAADEKDSSMASSTRVPNTDERIRKVRMESQSVFLPESRLAPEEPGCPAQPQSACRIWSTYTGCNQIPNILMINPQAVRRRDKIRVEGVNQSYTV